MPDSVFGGGGASESFVGGLVEQPARPAKHAVARTHFFIERPNVQAGLPLHLETAEVRFAVNPLVNSQLLLTRDLYRMVWKLRKASRIRFAMKRIAIVPWTFPLRLLNATRISAERSATET